MSSIITQIEKCIKRYDYLMEKYSSSKQLTDEEYEELKLLAPNVARPLLMMIELIQETFDEHKDKNMFIQTGGSEQPDPRIRDAITKALPDMSDEERETFIKSTLIHIVAQLAVSLKELEMKDEQSSNAEPGSNKKYKDIGSIMTSAGSALIKAIKSMFSGAASDADGLLDQIDPKTMIPDWAGKSEEDKAAFYKAIESETKEPLQNLKKNVASDIREIASSSIEGLLNALSLVPGVGTTLQLWRFLQNMLTIIAKTTNTIATSKKEAGKLKDVVNKASTSTPAPAPGAQTVVVVGGNANQQSEQSPQSEQSQQSQQSAMTGGESNESNESKTDNDKHHHKLWTAKRHKKEYKKSVKEFKRTRRRFVNYLKRKIL